VTTRINNGDGRQAQQAAEDARAGAEHSAGAHAQQTHASKVHMQRMKAAKLQHDKAQHAGFYRNKRFATSNHKPTSATAQKLMRQLGQRPRPAPSAKENGKDALAREWREQAHGGEEKHKQHERQEGHERQEKREEDDAQQNGQHSGQHSGSEQQAPRNGQDRERREKHSKFAVKARKSTSAHALPNGLQAIAKQHRDSPELRQALAAAYTRAVVRLTSKMELGPLLAPLLVLDMASPGVLARKPARLHAQRNGVLACRGAAPGAAAAVGVLEQSLDLTLARQTFGIEYSEADQSLAMVKQRLLDATADAPAATAKRGAVASGNSQEVRVGPVVPGGNP
jgi:hypothetical protein